MSSGGIELPPGFRFHPTDEELVMHYLIRKCGMQPISAPIIAEIDLYKFDPWQLPEMALYGEKEWYFFSPRDRKYPNGSRPNRAAGTGYWKATGADKPIGKPKTVGIKKALVFYAGKAPKGVKTNWIMHEYRLANVDRSAGKKNNNLRLDDWVLCRIYNKKGSIEKQYNLDQKSVQLSEPIEEDIKPEILTPDQIKNFPAVPQSSNFDTDSMPRSSCSEHVLSPEITWEKEVQSEAKWNNDFDRLLDFQFGCMDDPFQDEMLFGAPAQAPFEQNNYMQSNMFQDMFMYTPKPL